MQAVLSYPVKDILYELVPDHNNIKNRYIINDDEWYTGAELKYWFFINKINIEPYKQIESVQLDYPKLEERRNESEYF